MKKFAEINFALMKIHKKQNSQWDIFAGWKNHDKKH